MLKRWWRRHQHWLIPVLIILAVLAAAAPNAVAMRMLTLLAGFAVNMSILAVVMIVPVVFYFGFVFYYLGSVKMVKAMPGEAGEVTIEDDYWGQPELVKVARQWTSLLEKPARLCQMGGQPVTGMLLSGPPGVGKIFLARCMAGSASIPFLGLDGSRLASMWLGVGSIKVMRLFANAHSLAKRYGACIVFIDKLDAIGAGCGTVTGGQKQAGMSGGVPAWGAGAGVLNTLLTQLEGLNEQRGRLKALWYKLRGKGLPPDYTLFVIGATSRPDALDPALIRTRCLDVKIRVDPPTKAGRIEIIRGYLGKIKCVEEIDVEGFASDTTGLTPADLKAIIMQRAPVRALGAGRAGITNEDLQASLAGQSMRLRDEDKEAIAYYEAGHAVAAWALTDDRVTRASIIRHAGRPSGGAGLGHVSHVPDGERWNLSFSEVEAKICISLAGRAAELEFLGEAHTGARSDLMSVRAWLLGLVEEGYFPSLGYRTEPTDDLIKEMDALVERSMKKTRRTLRKHGDKAKALVAVLLEREKLNEKEVMAILGERPGQAREDDGEPSGRIVAG